ncbi:MAG: ABC transporter ATP-binding protein [Nitriliruptoraceae bacterium]
MSLLAIRELVVRFGSTTAVDRVSLDVAPGEIVGLIGANGAGKTTTLRVALGIERATSGDVDLLGDLPAHQRRRAVGYVPQSLGLWQDLTVAQNLAFVAAAFGVAEPRLPASLAGSARVAVADLPLGQRRRLAFEAALCHAPRLLILDEPTSGVGPLERSELWDRIAEARDAGAGLLVTTHHLSEAEQCDRVIILLAGQVAAAGTIEDLRTGHHATVVRAADRTTALRRLDTAFPAVSLAGHDIRVPGAPLATVATALGDLAAELDTAPATFDEVFVGLARQT